MQDVPIRITCRYCEWSARASGPWTDDDHVRAAAQQLKSELIAHTARIHPEAHTPGQPPLGAGVDRLLELPKKE